MKCIRRSAGCNLPLMQVFSSLASLRFFMIHFIRCGFFLSIVVLCHLGPHAHMCQAQQVIDTIDALPPRHSLSKKLIEFGWGMRTADQIRADMPELAQRPFNGLVFRTKWPEYAAGFPQSIFYPQLVSESSMQLDSLAAIEWSPNLTDNFLRFWVAGYQQARWFDDAQWSRVLANARLISKANKAAKTKGIFFDTEHYGGTIWKYDSVLYPGLTLGQVEAKVRERGVEMMHALQTHSPDIRIFCTGAWIFPSWEAGGKLENITRSEYCLLKAFSDGLLEGASGDAMIIDGNEIGYYWRNTINWHYPPGAYRVISENRFIEPTLRQKAKSNMQVGHAIYFTPYKPITSELNKKRLEHHIYQALLCSDEYAWFYQEEPNDAWWTEQVPPGVDSAVRSALSKLANRNPPGFIVKDDVPIASNDLKIRQPVQNEQFTVGDTISFEIEAAPIVKTVTYVINYIRQPDLPGAPARHAVIARDTGYYVVYAISNGYQKMSAPVRFHVGDRAESSAVRDIATAGTSLVYPNPARNSVHIDWCAGIPMRYALDVYTAHGALIHHEEDVRGTAPLTIDVSTWPAGSYSIILRTRSSITSFRLVKDQNSH
jgi:hypothetical protein